VVIGTHFVEIKNIFLKRMKEYEYFMVYNITYRSMEPDEIDRMREIDRTETVRIGYSCEAAQLERMSVDWEIPNFLLEDTGEHSLAHQIDFCRGHLNAGGCMIGAFDGHRMVGIGVLRPELRPGLAQLAYLQVTNGYRRQGVASRLAEKLFQYAAAIGADHVYVSATPSGSAVGFYLRQGFSPVEQPLPELYALEPEDIHMVKDLRT
jgi:GNAT superfamily N-acetyltransferase